MLIYQRVIAICSQWFLNIINISHIFPRCFFSALQPGWRACCVSLVARHGPRGWTALGASPALLCLGMEFGAVSRYGKIWKLYHEIPRSHIYIYYIYMTIWQFEWGLNQSFYKHTMGYHRYMPQFYVNSTAMDCNMETMRNHWIVGQLLFGENQLVTMMERAAKFWLRLQVKHTLVPSCELRW